MRNAANTSIGLANARPAWRLAEVATAGLPPRKNGFAASSDSMVEGSDGLPAASAAFAVASRSSNAGLPGSAERAKLKLENEYSLAQDTSLHTGRAAKVVI